MTQNGPPTNIVDLAALREAGRTVLSWADRDPTQPCDWQTLVGALTRLEPVAESPGRLGHAVKNLIGTDTNRDGRRVRRALRELARALGLSAPGASEHHEQLHLKL